MKIVYIAHPIAGDIKGNLEKVRLIVRDINLREADIVPFAPYWLDCHAMNDNSELERNRGIKNDVELLARGFVEEVWVYGDWKKSRGVLAEMALAEKLKIPVVIK